MPKDNIKWSYWYCITTIRFSWQPFWKRPVITLNILGDRNAKVLEWGTLLNCSPIHHHLRNSIIPSSGVGINPDSFKEISLQKVKNLFDNCSFKQFTHHTSHQWNWPVVNYYSIVILFVDGHNICLVQRLRKTFRRSIRVEKSSEDRYYDIPSRFQHNLTYLVRTCCLCYCILMMSAGLQGFSLKVQGLLSKRQLMVKYS